MANEVFVKAMAGTGANIDVYCGFQPSYVRVKNITSAGGEELEWFVGMTDGHAFKRVYGAGAATDPNTKITTLGITMLNSTTLGYGFRIGTDADVNVAAENIVITAHRGGEGNQLP